MIVRVVFQASVYELKCLTANVIEACGHARPSLSEIPVSDDNLPVSITKWRQEEVGFLILKVLDYQNRYSITHNKNWYDKPWNDVLHDALDILETVPSVKVVEQFTVDEYIDYMRGEPTS